MTDDEWSDWLRVTADHLALVHREYPDAFAELAGRAATVYDLAQCMNLLVRLPDHIERCQRQNGHDGPCRYALGHALGEAIREATARAPEGG